MASTTFVNRDREDSRPYPWQQPGRAEGLRGGEQLWEAGNSQKLPPPRGPWGHSLGRPDPDLCVLRKLTAEADWNGYPEVTECFSPHLTQESAESLPILQMGTGRLRAVDQNSLEVTQWHHW